MESDDDITYTTSWKLLVIQTFVKNGPWALLSILLLLVVGYEIDRFGIRYIAMQERYIAQATESVATLHRAMEAVSSAIVARSVEHQTQSQSLTAIVKLMEDAHQMMKAAPARSDQILATLEKIEQHLRSMEQRAVRREQ